MTAGRILTLTLITVMIVAGLFVTTASAGKSTKVKMVSVTVKATGIQLQWKPVTGADGYRIYHQAQKTADRNSLWFDVFAEQTTVLYTDVQPQTRYSFRVAILNGNKQGPLSAPASAIWKATNKSASDSAP